MSERKVRIIKTDLSPDQRVESGAVQFNDDWPGLFLRGDDVMCLHCCIMDIDRAKLPDHIYIAWTQLKNIIEHHHNDVIIRHEN